MNGLRLYILRRSVKEMRGNVASFDALHRSLRVEMRERLKIRLQNGIFAEIQIRHTKHVCPALNPQRGAGLTAQGP